MHLKTLSLQYARLNCKVQAHQEARKDLDFFLEKYTVRSAGETCGVSLVDTQQATV